MHITGTRRSGSVPSTTVLHKFLSFFCTTILCRLYKLTLFTKLKSTDILSFRFGLKIFRRFALIWGPEKIIFTGPVPPLGRPALPNYFYTLFHLKHNNLLSTVPLLPFLTPTYSRSPPPHCSPSSLQLRAALYHPIAPLPHSNIEPLSTIPLLPFLTPT